MAQYKTNAAEFIQHVFSPMVAVMTSALVDNSCKKSYISFAELLQPFTKLSAETSLRDPGGGAAAVKNLRLSIIDINHRPPQATLARKLLNLSVDDIPENNETVLEIGPYSLEVPSTVPWFEKWRETFFQVQYPSDHEFTKHFIGCMIVISSEEQTPFEMVEYLNQKLTQLLSVTPTKLPKWIGGSVLRYYVVLHDNTSVPINKAESIYESLKNSYGTDKCFLLSLNSHPPLSDPVENPSQVWYPYVTEPYSDRLVTDEKVPDSSESSSDTNIAGAEEAYTDTDVSMHSTDVTFHPLSPDVDQCAQSVSKINYWTNKKEGYRPYLKSEDDVPENNSEADILKRIAASLTPDDIEMLRRFIKEFCLRALIPHVEREIWRITDSVSNKKGVSRSLFSATKRWFGTSKPGTAGFMPANAIVYGNDSPELQLRRLGDLYFMFGHYSMAYQAYHSVKRDFNTDQAWLYYAGALEMAALSAFMNGEASVKSVDYMEESIVTYLNSCRMPQFATRATLLSAECLRASRQWGEAAKQLIRMTSEESDLRSALLLEQAAYCFLSCERPRMVRKYAFHIVLAGHRFSKAGQRKHSLRCYKQAYRIYFDKGWTLAEDHIHFTIGRQASNLKLVDEAVNAFSKLLSTNSQQTNNQQSIFLREFITTYGLLSKNAESSHSIELPVLPLPIIHGNDTKVLLTPLPPVTTPGKTLATSYTFNTDLEDTVAPKWAELEKMLVQEAQGTLPMLFKPSAALLSSRSDNTTIPSAVVAETVRVNVLLENPLKIPLDLQDLGLCWELQTSDGVTLSNEQKMKSTDAFIHTMQLKTQKLAPESQQSVTLSLTPLVTGELKIKGIMYNLSGVSNSVQSKSTESTILTSDTTLSVYGKQLIHVHGRKLKSRERAQTQKMYALDYRLCMTVISAAPCLQVTFSNIHSEVLCGELQAITVDFINHGRVSLSNIFMASPTPHLFSLCSEKIPKHSSFLVESNLSIDNPTAKAKERRKKFVIQIQLPGSYKGCLKPGQSYSFTLWLRAPEKKGHVNVDILIYYENVKNILPKYRLVRHTWQLFVQDSLYDNIDTQISHLSDNYEILNILVHVKNANQVFHDIISEISLLQTTLVSRRWKLNGSTHIPDGCKMNSQEAIDFVLKANKDVVFFPHEPLMSSVAFCCHDRLSSMSKYAYEDFCSRSIAEPSILIDEDIPPKKINEYSEGVLILFWFANIVDSVGVKRTAVGQHHIKIDSVSHIEHEEKSQVCIEPNGTIKIFGEDSSEIEKNKNDLHQLMIKQKYLIYTLSYSQVVKHDFKKNSICVVPVTLHLFSSASMQLDAFVKTLNEQSRTYIIPDKTFPRILVPNSSTAFRFVGYAAGNTIQILPQGTAKVPLRAAFVRPGTYEIASRIEVYCQPSKTATQDGFVLQIWDLLGTIIILEN